VPSVSLRRSTRPSATAALKNITNHVNDEVSVDYTLHPHLLVDRYVAKDFDGVVFEGKVEYFKAPWFHVIYDDGDEEDYNANEILDMIID